MEIEYTLNDRARAANQQVIDNLGVSPEEYARALGVDPQRFISFQKGTLATLTESEIEKIGEAAGEFHAAELRDAADMERQGFPRPRTMMDAWNFVEDK